MKRFNLLYIIICFGLTFTSCDDFLDVIPNNSIEIDSETKVAFLLTSAYSGLTSVMMEEMSSDNAMDNGSKFTFESQEHEDAYLWNDITNEGNDSPHAFWSGSYEAIAAANQALEAIEELGNPASLQAYRGEALICRAYAHFSLANTFCLPYNPETAKTDLGVPYSTVPENVVFPKYKRGNLYELYEKINADIEAALPLIDDYVYSVPKYHFNKKAAYAFATRFNLYYHNYDKVIQYAELVLGKNPEKVLRNWAAVYATAHNWDLRADMYISANEPANLLLIPVTSNWGYWVGPYSLGERYGHSALILFRETVFSDGVWGEDSNIFYPANSVFGNDQKQMVSKVGGYFHYLDKVNGIGYRKNVIVNFATDETLLCRAEAYILKGKLDKATADINIWLSTHTTTKVQRTTKEIVDIYEKITYMPLQVMSNNQRSPKKKLNPRGFTVTNGNQENMIHCILHLRRIENIHEGLRWQDIKRYGIEITHNRSGKDDDVLTVNDPRRAIQLPQVVINAGLDANPR